MDTMGGYKPLEEERLVIDAPPSMDLPTLPRPFFVPPLTEQPQNPIMNRLEQKKDLKGRDNLLNNLLESRTLFQDLLSEPVLHKSTYDIWLDALTRNYGPKKQASSWDALCSQHPKKASISGFLTEQDNSVFASTRYNVNPPLHDPEVDMICVTKDNLLNALKSIVLGTSSVYHTWDATTERFIQVGLGDHKRRFLLIDGADNTISDSLISRFITIGSLLRRLDTLLMLLRARTSKDNPTVHAYTHALSTILTYLRHSLARGPPADDPFAMSDTLSVIWMHYEIYQEILEALAELNGRDLSKSPSDYPVFDPSPVALISAIYSQLNYHMERQSLHAVTAIFAFMITHVSHEYLQLVSRSVGYCVNPVRRASRPVHKQRNIYSLNDEFDDEAPADDNSEHLQLLGDTFPNFFPTNLAEILPAAQKSLILLEGAQPDHPILQHTTTRAVISWFWSHEQIRLAWQGNYPDTSNNNGGTPPLDVRCHTGDLPTEFSIFQFFDQEPGSNIRPALATNMMFLESFIERFPASLPSMTPTLSQLTALVLGPLVAHASNLSSALLDVFLTPSTSSIDTLNFQTHAVLLRSYLLVTSTPFKIRLAAALFSDQEDPGYDFKPHGMSIRSLRRKSRRNRASTDSSQPWPVGLAPSLLERETWPPVGADLSFFLRTVIVDSFLDGKWGNVCDTDEDSEVSKNQVLEEAEYRLGFTIKDLPVGPGRDRWLSPLSIEALDFLSMDYKPPTPLEVLITPEILSKYQRVFTFILRLMRVEHALGSLFRMTRTTTKILFPTLVSYRKLLLHFRFTVHAFVTSLSAYVFDVAIGGNFDPFILSLVPRKGDHYTNFSDVFVLAKRHSALLDDVLTACLLRSSQRAVGEVLRNVLELILEFTVVIGELYRGRLEEYQAAPTLDDLWAKLSSKMRSLMKALKGLADKSGSLPSSLPLQSVQAGDFSRKPVGGVTALSQLFIRLDLGDWWSQNTPQT